jgi:hypothetical protein
MPLIMKRYWKGECELTPWKWTLSGGQFTSFPHKVRGTS